MAIWVTVFTLTMLIYSLYLSFKLTCTPSMHKLLIGLFVKLPMLTVAFMLNFLWLLIKWIRWYFLGTNTTLCQCAYIMHILCALFRALQFSFIILPYISMLKLLTNPNAIVVPLCNFSKNVQVKKNPGLAIALSFRVSWCLSALFTPYSF